MYQIVPKSVNLKNKFKYIMCKFLLESLAIGGTENGRSVLKIVQAILKTKE
jgi:hypothetical protein